MYLFNVNCIVIYLKRTKLKSRMFKLLVGPPGWTLIDTDFQLVESRYLPKFISVLVSPNTYLFMYQNIFYANLFIAMMYFIPFWNIFMVS